MKFLIVKRDEWEKNLTKTNKNGDGMQTLFDWDKSYPFQLDSNQIENKKMSKIVEK